MAAAPLSADASAGVKSPALTSPRSEVTVGDGPKNTS